MYVRNPLHTCSQHNEDIEKSTHGTYKSSLWFREFLQTVWTCSHLIVVFNADTHTHTHTHTIDLTIISLTVKPYEKTEKMFMLTIGPNVDDKDAKVDLRLHKSSQRS